MSFLVPTETKIHELFVFSVWILILLWRYDDDGEFDWIGEPDSESVYYAWWLWRWRQPFLFSLGSSSHHRRRRWPSPPPLFSHFFCNFLEREREFWCRESLGVKEWFSIERIWVLLEREKKWKFSFPWERERERERVWDFKFVLDWKIYVICNFAHFRSRWIKTWEWYLNSHDLIIFIFYLSSVWLLRKVGRKENMQVSFNVLMFWGKGELVLLKKKKWFA